MPEKKKCYFCEMSENTNNSMYVFQDVDGKHVPVRVPVCKECKSQYEESFPKHK